jgi:hypothetical protein
MPQQILPPEHTSPVPDAATRTGLPDHTGGGAADGRVLRINFGFFKFGTDDKSQAIALILSVLLLAIITALAVFANQTDTIKDLMGLLKSAVLLTIGVAVGNSGSGKQDKP